MHKKIPKICTGCRVSAAKIYLYHSTKIAKARPHRVECPIDSSVQRQWSMTYISFLFKYYSFQVELEKCFTVYDEVLSQTLEGV